MRFRHEYKHEISYSDYLALRSRLGAVMSCDDHAKDGKYTVHSMYFDTPYDKALREKKDGINRREKFRLRYYDNDALYIKLEKKSKSNGLCLKEQAQLLPDEAMMLINGDIEHLKNSESALLRELCLKMETQLLRPVTIVDYIREPFVFEAGNVRVTLDCDIRTGLKCMDFLNPEHITVPIENSPIILEIKWDSFLPSVIQDLVQLNDVHTAAYSKYAACRIYD